MGSAAEAGAADGSGSIFRNIEMPPLLVDLGAQKWENHDFAARRRL
uniref:Uncharacterized protein n=1 Tax=Marseillevirus LCMAC103 TaxID=2506604 RepID=A0A481YUS6_9VIRU|nr:MAG: hypothetical protein LCMAC103_01870 [Marseillevirus LCMAC103]